MKLSLDKFHYLCWLRRRVSAVSALRSLGRAAVATNKTIDIIDTVFAPSREPTVIRGFRETRRRNKKITDSRLTIRYFWLRRRDLNPRPFGPQGIIESFLFTFQAFPSLSCPQPMLSCTLLPTVST